MKNRRKQKNHPGCITNFLCLLRCQMNGYSKCLQNVCTSAGTACCTITMLCNFHTGCSDDKTSPFITPSKNCSVSPAVKSFFSINLVSIFCISIILSLQIKSCLTIIYRLPLQTIPDEIEYHRLDRWYAVHP